MKVVAITRYGGPDVLEVQNRPEPEPGPGQVRVKVRASGVNFADILTRIGLYPDAPKPPVVVGYEVAGHIEKVGAGVTSRSPGDRVLAFTRFGGYAEMVTVDARLTFPVPPRTSDAEAAALPVNYVTAAIALYKQASIAPGETVLIHNAGGGVGIAATQLARLRRARIIGTASAAKHDALRSFGVDHVIDRRANIAAEVKRLTSGRGVDVILDARGGSGFGDSYRLLAPLGRLIIYGVSSVVAGERRRWLHTARELVRMRRFSPLSLINANRGVLGLNVGHLWSERDRLVEVMDMLLTELRTGRIQPVIARTFPLERAGDAHRYIQSRANIGKVILTVT